MGEMPKGWIKARIYDLTEKVSNIKPETYPERKYGYVDISSIDNSKFRIAAVKTFKGNEAPSRARRPLLPNDVLFSNVRTYLRNVAVVSPDTAAKVCSTGFTVLRPNGSVEPYYLFRYVLTDEFIHRVTPKQTGTHYPATSDRVVMAEGILLPPLNEQRRIVAKLEKLLHKVDACKERLDKIPVILRRFRQSVLAAACSGRLTADWRETNGGEHWNAVMVGTAFKSFGGGTPDRRNSSYWGGKIPWLSSGDIKAERIEAASESITQAGLDNSSARLCPPGSVLVVVRSGILKHTLPVAVLRKKTAINQDIKCFDSGNSELNSWLALVWRSAARAILDQNREGTTVQSVKFETLRDFELRVPPTEERQEIVRRVDALFKKADEIEARYKKAKTFVDRLTQSILAKAFRGELVPQDPNDEPASVLLERIRAEKKEHETYRRVKMMRKTDGHS